VPSSNNLSVYFDFVPLHFQSAPLQYTPEDLSKRILTFNRLAVLGSMTLRMSRTSCVNEEPTCPCFIMKDFGVPSFSVFDTTAAGPLRCVRFLRLRAMLRLLLFAIPKNLDIGLPNLGRSPCDETTSTLEVHPLSTSTKRRPFVDLPALICRILLREAVSITTMISNFCMRSLRESQHLGSAAGIHD
jgi:hypothetical protein